MRRRLALVVPLFLLTGCAGTEADHAKKEERTERFDKDYTPQPPGGNAYGGKDADVSGVVRFKVRWLKKNSVAMTGKKNGNTVFGPQRATATDRNYKEPPYFVAESENIRVVPGDMVSMEGAGVLTNDPGLIECIIIHHNLEVRKTTNPNKGGKHIGECSAAYKVPR
jgi:hypothetical protein